MHPLSSCESVSSIEHPVAVTRQERYDAMRFYFRKELEGIVRLAPAAAGTHMIGWLRDARPHERPETFAMKVARAAATEDLVVFPLSRYAIEQSGADALVLGYGGITPRRIA